MFNSLRYLLLFALIFGFFASVRAFDYYSEYEEEDSDGGLYFFQSPDGMNNGFTYPNGTALMQFVHSFANASLQFKNNLYIRLLHPNGTLTKFTLPTYNIAKYNLPYAFPLNDGYVLVTQADDTIMHGTLVDWNGQVLQM